LLLGVNPSNSLDDMKKKRHSFCASELARIYNASFFAEWGRGNQAYVASAGVIVEVLFEKFAPGRVIDLGCGCGVYSHFFCQKNVALVAVDGVRPPREHAFEIPVEIRDLSVPFENVWGAFDLALCLDVGEHIYEEDCDAFLSNVTNFSDRLLMSCAPPGQGGHHHVNEQPKRYWIERLRRHGFCYDRRRTGELCETFKIRRTELMWMWEHISVYNRDLSTVILNPGSQKEDERHRNTDCPHRPVGAARSVRAHQVHQGAHDGR